MLFTKQGFQKIVHVSNKERFKPIDKTCTCMTCQNYTISYLHHLFKAKEMVGSTLATIHNLHFMVELMTNYRLKILNDEL